MRRSKLVVTAGALSATAFAATVAIGAGFGLVGQAEPNSRVGRLDDQHRIETASVTETGHAVAVTPAAFEPHADD